MNRPLLSFFRRLVVLTCALSPAMSPLHGQSSTPNVQSLDAAGDSITKAFNAQSAYPCPNTDQEHLNWATSDTHGTSLCSAGSDGVYSHAEVLECYAAGNIVAAYPNSAASGARMLRHFVNQAVSISSFLSAQPAPRYTTVLLGHNDICGGTVEKYQTSCPSGSDQDPNNYCRTTAAAFEREFRKGLDLLIAVPDLQVGVAAIARVSQLCNHTSKKSCSTIGRMTCQQLWKNALSIATIFGDSNGICGSVTVDCSQQRVVDAYLTAKAYRDILDRVTAEYAAIPEGSTSNIVTVGGQTVGGAVKASGVTLVFSNAAWMYKFKSDQLSCCDCFHPSSAGQDAISRVLFEGLKCSSTDVCCKDTGDPASDALCKQTDVSGTIYGGFFSAKR